MRASDFEYHLPQDLVAQAPLPDRAGSRLLVLDRASGNIRHARFPELVDLLAPEDVLVLNLSRVIPARLHGMREAGCARRAARRSSCWFGSYPTEPGWQWGIQAASSSRDGA